MNAPDFRPAAALRQYRRFAGLDMARGVALVAMATYHMVWDLGYLRLTAENAAMVPSGKLAAHLIAGTFLVLVGIGLVLMNRNGIRWRPFLLRLARIGGAALAITAATWFAFPDSFIFFGILHCIAVSSVLALPFLRLPVAVVLVATAAILAAPHLLSADILDAPALAFLGLGRVVPQTNDYVPLFPWFGLVLAGVAAARLVTGTRLAASLATMTASAPMPRGLAFAGRHSLAIYLIHQPVLLALLTGLVTLTGPNPKAGMADFRQVYERNCIGTGGTQAACRIAARCVMDALRREGLWAEGGRRFTLEERARAQVLSQDCYEAADRPQP